MFASNALALDSNPAGSQTIEQIEKDAKNPKVGNVKFTHHVIYNIGAALAQIGKKLEAVEKLQWGGRQRLSKLRHV